MDGKRFDSWTRNHALRLSRRNALRLAAASGATAFAAGPLESLAQSPCTLTLHGETAGGPSAPTVYDGKLTYSLGADGSLTSATYTPTGGAPTQVNGTIVGRAIDLLITLSPGKLLALSGTADKQSPTCPTAAAGVLTGPQLSDLGAWQATGTSGAQPSAPITNPAPPTNPSISGSNCPAPSLSCGPNCCPGGATCTDTAQGICACPNGTTQCGNSCVTNCPNGQTLDLDSCTCITACSPDQTACQFDFECCNGACLNGACGSCPGLLCGEMGCVDHMSDPNNCGSCGNVCVDDTGFCLSGSCQCIPDNEPVGSSSSSCCSHTFVSATGLCGCAQMRENCSGTGECCDAPSGVVCVEGRSGFEICCIWTTGVCGSDADCCFDFTCVGGACIAPS